MSNSCKNMHIGSRVEYFCFLPRLFGAQFAALSAFLASLFEGLPVAGGEDAGMTGAFRVTLATPNGSVLLSPYGFIDTPARRARLAASIADRLPRP